MSSRTADKIVDELQKIWNKLIELEGRVKKLEGKMPKCDCGSEEFLKGPRGGMSINIKCMKCGATYNYYPGFLIEKLSEGKK
jgi:hypothetical protein